jgi:hypothetical protein
MSDTGVYFCWLSPVSNGPMKGGYRLPMRAGCSREAGRDVVGISASHRHGKRLLSVVPAACSPAAPAATVKSNPTSILALTRSPTAIATPTLAAGATQVWDQGGSIMVYVPEGEFLM